MANTEPAVNTMLALCLRGMNPRWLGNSDAVRSEPTQAFLGRGRPDLLIRAGGAPVVIEAEFDPASTVEKDVDARLGRSLDDGTEIESVIGVVYPARLKEVAEGALREELRRADDLAWFVKRRLPDGDDRFPAKGMLTGGVSPIADAVEALMLSPSLLSAATDQLEETVNAAAGVLTNIVTEVVRSEMAACLNQEDSEQTRRMASAIVANALLFQIAVAESHDSIPNLNQIEEDGVFEQSQVLTVWGQILDLNYWPIFDIARRLLEPMHPAKAMRWLSVLGAGAQKLAAIGAVEVQDLAGQMFGRLITDRKFLATFYTLPSSATLLTELALARLDQQIDWADESAVQGLRVADLACGTGALLSSAYHRLGSRMRRHGLDDSEQHKAVMEHVLIGADVMPAAAHLTTTMLSAVHPDQPYERCAIHVLGYGKAPVLKAGTESNEPEHEDTLLGSLDLIDESSTPSFLGHRAERLAGRREFIQTGPDLLELQQQSLDVCVMNPPFTRPTSHEATDVPVPSFAGFATSDDEQRAMSTQLKKKGRQGMAGHGNAGLASNFLDLAHQKVKPGGVLALVLPQSFIAGHSWRKARRLLTEHYERICTVSLSEVDEGADARAFSADTGIAEVLLVAVRRNRQRLSETLCAYVALHERPRDLLEACQLAVLINDSVSRTESTPKRLNIGNTTVGWTGTLPFGPDVVGHPSGVTSPDVVSVAVSLSSGLLQLPRVEPARLPISPLGDLGDRGPVDRDIQTGKHDAKARGPFELVRLQERSDGRELNYPILWWNDYVAERTMSVTIDAMGDVRDNNNTTPATYRSESQLVGVEGSADLPKGEQLARRLWNGYITTKGSERIAGATRLHINRLWQINSQAVAACMTPVKAIGGQAWPSFHPHGGATHEKALCAWLNTTPGIIVRWWVSNRQQKGRANRSVTMIGTIPVIDLRELSDDAVSNLAAVFDQFEHEPMLPGNEAYRDDTRKALDRAVLIDVLGLPEDILEPLDVLRLQWCKEPSVHGGKSTRPL